MNEVIPGPINPLRRLSQLYINRRMIAIFMLGFSSGLPFALTGIGSTLQARYTVAGVSLMTIGMLTLASIPYQLKWLWSPLLDRFVVPLLGRRRGWILLMQCILALCIAAMAFVNPQHHALLLGLIALAVALFSATQDIAINAYTTDMLFSHERGIGSAMTTSGWRVAALVSGGLAMALAAVMGWSFMFLLVAGLMLLNTLITAWAPQPQRNVSPPQTVRAALVDPFKEFFTRSGMKVGVALLALIICYKFSDALSLALSTTFLLRGVGFSLMDVGTIYKVVGLIAVLLGSFAGGGVLVKLGLFRALLIFGIMQALACLLFVSLAIVGKNYALMVITIFTDQFTGGMATVAFVALLMSLCHTRFTATQYALLSALALASHVVVGPLAAFIVKHVGWADFYLMAMFFAIPGIVLLILLRRRIQSLS